jgi:hypothetical protein
VGEGGLKLYFASDVSDMRRFLSTLLCLMPFIAAGQTLSGARGDNDTATRLLNQQPDRMAEIEPGVMVPLWKAADGRMLTLQANTSNSRVGDIAPITFSAVDATRALSTGLKYDLGKHLSADANVSEHSWVNTAAACAVPDSTACVAGGAPPRIVASEVGASYNYSGYSVGLGLGSSFTSTSSLPRIVPGTPGSWTASGLPLSALSSSTQLNARGRVPFDAKSGLDLGASVGRIRLLPGNLLGISAVDQKALSLGVDRGPISGSIVGRVMQPEAGAINSLNADRRWSSIDLGVTLRLPWQGQLSIGAQNVWSSGNAPTPAAGPEPDQSRTPYVQYHQDL